MAVVWSWAFGSEGKSPMETYLGFEYINGGGTQAPFTGADNVYSYASYPGTKYSWGTSAVRGFRFPSTVAAPGAGTVAVALKAKTTWYANQSSPLLLVEGVSDPTDMLALMYVSNAATSTIAMYVDSTLVGTISLTLDDWHYVAISYDFGVTTPNTATATFFVNGAQVATGSDSSGPTGTETKVRITSGGFSNTLGLVAQCISYDTGTSQADAAAPIFVTRVTPNADTSDVGTWSPASGGTNQVTVTAGAYNNATYAQEATPSSGDNVVTEVNNLATQLGLTPGIVRAGTNHTYSSGTNLQAFASIRDSGGAYTNGATVTPDQNDTTYAYGTSTGLTGSSTINVKYEVV